MIGTYIYQGQNGKEIVQSQFCEFTSHEAAKGSEESTQNNERDQNGVELPASVLHNVRQQWELR